LYISYITYFFLNYKNLYKIMYRWWIHICVYIYIYIYKQYFFFLSVGSVCQNFHTHSTNSYYCR